jgi:hypothetical protein
MTLNLPFCIQLLPDIRSTERRKRRRPCDRSWRPSWFLRSGGSPSGRSRCQTTFAQCQNFRECESSEKIKY